MKIDFSIIRFVPNPVRGEFANIGIIVGTNDLPGTANGLSVWQHQLTDEWALADLLDSRCNPVSSHSLPKVREFLSQTFPALFECWKSDGMQANQALEKLHHDWQNIIQLSEPSVIIDISLKSALLSLWHKYIS